MLRAMILHISSGLSSMLSKVRIHKSRMVIGLIAVGRLLLGHGDCFREPTVSTSRRKDSCQQ